MPYRKILTITTLCLLLLSVLSVQTGWSHTEHPKSQPTTKTMPLRRIETYRVPDVKLVNQDGNIVGLAAFLNADKPVLLNFVFTTCTTICPVLSASFANFQKHLGPASEQVRLVSITIDPEHDTPEALKAYGQRYGAQSGWEFLTGNREAIDRVMRAFHAYVTNKMGHYPLTLLRAPGGDRWVRIDGLMGTRELMEAYQTLLQP